MQYKVHNLYLSGPMGMWVQQRFKSVCPYMQSDESLHFQPEEMLDPWLMCRLIWVFGGCTYQLVPFAGHWLTYRKYLEQHMRLITYEQKPPING